MADHQPAIRTLREGTKLLGLGEGQRKRLFDKNVFARLDSTTREFGMYCGRCRDCHASDAGIAQHRLEFSDWRTIMICEFVRCGTVGIADRRERTKLGKITDQVLAPIAAANGSDPH